MMQAASKKFRQRLKRQPLSLHNHMMGLSPDKFKKYGLDDVIDIVHISFDRKQKPFISTIEPIFMPKSHGYYP